LADFDISIPVIFITGHGDIQMSVGAMKAGAIEFLTKPFRDQDPLDATHAALEKDQLLSIDGRGKLLTEPYSKL
jgi:FixJ family two-component response regulator